MSNRSHSIAVLIAASSVVSALAQRAHADIVGFPIPGWQVNQWDGGNLSPVNPPQSITLTTATSAQSRSAFFTTRQEVSQFQVDFTYTFTGSTANRMGAAFVLHNRPAGAGTVATGNQSGAVTNFGYSDFFGTFGSTSIAISMESSYQAPGSSSSGVYTGGIVGGGGNTTSTVVFSSGNPIDVRIVYDGSLLAMSAHDTVTGAMYTAPLVAVAIPTIVGDQFAYVGFTGSTGSNTGTTQTFSNFRFTSVPAPATIPVLALGGILGMTSGRRRSGVSHGER